MVDIANAEIHSSMKRNLEGNLILIVLGFVGITWYCRRNKQRPKVGSLPGPLHSNVTFLC